MRQILLILAMAALCFMPHPVLASNGFVTDITNRDVTPRGEITVKKIIEKDYYDDMLENGTLNERGEFTFRLEGEGYEETKTVVMSTGHERVINLQGGAKRNVMEASTLFKDLTPGDYRLYEEGSDWFTLEDVSELSSNARKMQDENGTYVLFHLTKENTGTAGAATFENTMGQGKIKVIKYGDKGKSKRLAGVTFELSRKDNGEVVGTKTTDKNGEVEFDEVERGSYYLVEKDTVDGYNLLPDPIDITVPLELTARQAEALHANTDKAIWSTADNKWLFYEFTYEIANDTPFTIPFTGGQEKLIALLVVGLAVVAGSVWARNRNKKEGENA